MSYPDSYESILKPFSESMIVQGGGLSYVAASFGKNTKTLKLSQFDRILECDLEHGVIQVEAGISLAKIYGLLEETPWTLPVQPGHPQITVGGCIAVNVHGKNQFREGLFENSVLEMELYHPHFGLKLISKNHNSELFWMTIGGLGLTGIIVTVKLQLKKKIGHSIEFENIPTRSIEETKDILEKCKTTHDLLYSWNDFSRLGRGGVGFVVAGKFSGREAIQKSYKTKKLDPAHSSFFPILNQVSTPILNLVYRLINTKLKNRGIQSFYDFTFPVHSKSFYFSLFGRKGFVERQILIPETCVDRYFKDFKTLLNKHNPFIVLGTLKVFAGTQRFLDFQGNGFCFSLDLPYCEYDKNFHFDLDELNLRLGCLDNFIKDSRVSSTLVKNQYSQYNSFKDALYEYDPKRLFRSALSERLGLDDRI